MKWIKTLLKTILFLTIFAGTVWIVNDVNYKDYQNASVEVADATLPSVYLKYGDYTVNRMLGYETTMDTAMLRDNILPVAEDKCVSVLLQEKTAEEFGSSMSYELRSLDGSTLIEEGTLTPGETENGYMEYQAEIRMNMTLGQEYIFVVRLREGADVNVRYYSRVVRLEREYLDSFLDYAEEFHNETLQDKTGEEDMDTASNSDAAAPSLITSAMEAYKSEESSSDLSLVTLNSTYDALTWGILAPSVSTEVIPQIRELDGESAVIAFCYAATSAAQGTISEYLVSEYYTLHYSNDGVELQDYQRYADTIFEPENVSAENNSINLGLIQSEDLEYMTSDNRKETAFIAARQLWFYDYKQNSVSKVYGYGADGVKDVREIQEMSDIDILSVDDDGVVDFIVYGRIERGSHEGENGILLYEYTKDSAEISELLFISCDLPYDILKLQVGKFAYYDREARTFYTLLNSALTAVNLDSGEVTQEMENMPENYVFVSEDGSCVAYPDSSDPFRVQQITVRNFETGAVTVEKAVDGYLEIVGFIENDLVYGEAKPENALAGADGCPAFLFSHIYIANEAGELVKDYHKDDILVSEMEESEGTIYLTRCKEDGDGNLTPTSDDYISYKEAETGSGVTVKQISDERESSQTHIVFPSTINIQSKTREVMTKEKQNENAVLLSVDGTVNTELCYRFLSSGLEAGYFSVGDAVALACTEGGIILDGNGNVVYRQKKSAEYNTVAGTFAYQSCESKEESLMACCYMSILSAGYEADYSVIREINDWEDAMAASGQLRGLNLSGVDIDTALGYLSDDIPFVVRIDDGRYVLVISYNASYIRYYDPIKGEEVRVTKSSFVKTMQENGNAVYTYIKY